MPDWPWLETMAEGVKERFLQKEGKYEGFEAVMGVGRIVGERMGRGKVGV